MSAWTYYSPLWLGMLLAIVMNDTIQGQLSDASALNGWLAVLAVGVVLGCAGQLLMIGAQGAFAQVLPVPIGRSIRGRGAAGAGFLIISSVVLAAAGALLRSETLGTAAMVVWGVSLAAGVAAAITYVWCWPIAVSDFDKRTGAS